MRVCDVTKALEIGGILIPGASIALLLQLVLALTEDIRGAAPGFE